MDPKIAILPVLMLLSWVAYMLTILAMFEGEHFLLIFALVSAYWVMPGGLAWAGYSAHLAKRLLPQVDSIVDSQMHEMVQRYGDSLFHRVHRLLMYSPSASSRLLNTRLHKQYDFKQLPARLRLPLRLHFYWLCAVNLSLVSGAAAFKLVQYFELGP